MDPPPPSFPPTASSPQPLPRKSPLVPPPIHHLNGNQGSPHHLGLSKAAKRRVRVACIQCKLSKVRCDDTRPCRRCVKRHMADMCVDAHQKPRGRKRSEDGMFISTSPSSTHKHAFLSPSSHGSHPYSPRPGSGRNSPAPSPSSAPLRRASPHGHNRNTSFGSMNTYQQKFVYSPSPLVQSLSLASAERSASVPIVSNNSSLRIHLSPPPPGGADAHSPASLARQALEFQQQQQQAALENSQQQMFTKFNFPDMSKGPPQFNQNFNVGFPSLLTATSSYAGGQGLSLSDAANQNDVKPSLYGDAKMVSSPPAAAGPSLLLGANTYDPVLAAQLAALNQHGMRPPFDGPVKLEGQMPSPPLPQQYSGPPALNMNLITQHNQAYMLPQPQPVGFAGPQQQGLPSFLQLAQGAGPTPPGMSPEAATLWNAMNAMQQMNNQDPNNPANGSPHNQSADASTWSYLRSGPFEGDGPAPMAQTPMHGGPTPTHGAGGGGGGGGGGMTRSGSSEMIADMNSSLDALFSAPPSSSAAQHSDLAMHMMGMGPPFDLSAFRPSPQSSPSHGEHTLPSPSSAPVPMLNPAHYLGSSLRMRSEFLHPRSPASESHASDHDSVRTHTPLPPGATRAASYSHSLSDNGYANDPALASLPSLSAHALRLHDPSTPRPESSSPVGMLPQQPHSGSSSSPVASPHLRNFDVASPSKSPFHNPPSNMRAHSCSSLPAGAGDSVSNAMLNFPNSPESFVTDSTPNSFSIQLELPSSALDQAADRPTIRPLFRDAHSIST